MVRPLPQLLGRTLPVLLATGILVSCEPAATRNGDAALAGPLNVLLIVVDDLNTDLGAYGNPRIHTPNIDRLAARGVRFDRAYAQYPLCVPSRISLFTGRYPDPTAPTTNRDNVERFGDTPFLPEFFRERGYLTIGIGKTGPGANLSPDQQLSDAAGAEEVTTGDDLEWDSGEAEEIAESEAPPAEVSRSSAVGYTSRWIERSLDRPFFATVGLEAPHLPFKAPADIRRLYPPYTLQIAAEPPGHLDDVPRSAFTETPPWWMNREWKTGEIDDLRRRQLIGDYYACIGLADRQVGELMESLDRFDLWRRTIVVLVSDHGFHLGEHGGLWRKMSLFEESLRVPMIVVAPGVEPGSSERVVELLDVYPTLVDLAGYEPPAALQGLSLASLLADPTAARDRSAFSVVHRDGERMGRSIRTERYRYIEWDGERLAQLYDHRNDPHEYRNLAADPARSADLQKFARLTKKRTRLASKKRPARRQQVDGAERPERSKAKKVRAEKPRKPRSR